ncbi:MAG: meso-butanediol dehydrogenase / (S,S)-butanediol dehydrogenase / diacetyl reductase [Acidobacteriota bacterium]|jgi:NAD(P)-dependent dehydrogenase (short-subunit alcohol dehydrogenase family)|nr:meso-butanediol dehydrogenase / (S,S)-butanediol dehydrogenase / diacetyl reductase [Acidobacteriota bacterium]
MYSFDGEVAIVTGASSGIGRATAVELARRGARVAIFARSAETLASIATPFGDAMLAVSGDVAAAADLDRLFAETEARLGPCSILVNCAGMIDTAYLVETPPERWERMFAVNVHGTYLACRRALPSMIDRKRGVIVNVASISGVSGPEKFPRFVSYCASKAAVIGLTEALAVEVKPHGVRVNAVSPGSVDTPMWAEASGGAPASMTPEEVAQTILFLASDASRPMNGQNLDVYSA